MKAAAARKSGSRGAAKAVSPSSPGPAYKVEHPGPNVCVVRCPLSGRTDWEQWFLLRGDAHHDNPKCDWAMERRHLDEAVRRGAGIIDIGDLFCAMQGKWDKRASYDNIRPEHVKSDYLGALKSTAADFYEPYARHFLVMGRGNHETSILDKHGFDLTSQLVGVLNDRTGSNIQAGGYSGWVRFMFTRSQRSESRRLWYIHGYGGGGPVTMDMIQSGNRQMVYIDADFMVSGHTHDSWQANKVRLKLNDANTIERRDIAIVKCGTYKDAYADGMGSWEVQRGHPPKPLGAKWLRFYWTRSGGIQHEIREAK